MSPDHRNCLWTGQSRTTRPFPNWKSYTLTWRSISGSDRWRTTTLHVRLQSRLPIQHTLVSARPGTETSTLASTHSPHSFFAIQDPMPAFMGTIRFPTLSNTPHQWIPICSLYCSFLALSAPFHSLIASLSLRHLCAPHDHKGLPPHLVSRPEDWFTAVLLFWTSCN